MKKIKVGTDCSGIEAPIQALKKLKVNFSHEFSCEIDKFARESIEANYSPKILFTDMTKKRKLPDIDMYICGFPCQTFSMAGSRKGMNDPRGTIFYDCLKVIKSKKPKIFVLENVKGLLSHDKGRTFEVIMNCLDKLKEYKIHFKVLNTKDYGIPQNRERVFIVGLKKSEMKREFKFPKKKKMKKIESYIDQNNNILENPTKATLTKLKKSKGVFVDLATINISCSPNSFQIYCPTINTEKRLWCKPKHRYASVKETLSLQGFPKSFNQNVSDSQLKKQIGNSMSVNVLVALFKCIFDSVS
jgi:DNA (cytosine-5)-methyltransferase 1